MLAIRKTYFKFSRRNVKMNFFSSRKKNFYRFFLGIALIIGCRNSSLLVIKVPNPGQTIVFCTVPSHTTAFSAMTFLKLPLM